MSTQSDETAASDLKSTAVVPEPIPHIDELVILDTETTGLDHKTERIIEIGAVRLSGGEITETFSELVKPDVPIRHSSFLIHGIPQETVDEAPPESEIIPKFLEFIGDTPYVAHNAIFDFSFIHEAMKRQGHKGFRNLRIDSLEMFRKVFPDEQSHSLSALTTKFGEDGNITHRALDDAMALAKVYPRLRELYQQRYDWQLSQMQNMPYLVERYLRLQRSVQILQSEMSDLKETFKIYFKEGGKSITASTGETLVFNWRRSYEYNEKVVWPVIMQGGVAERSTRLNTRQLDRLIDNEILDDDLLSQLKEARTGMHESINVTFLKPQAPIDEEDTEGESSNGSGNGKAN